MQQCVFFQPNDSDEVNTDTEKASPDQATLKTYLISILKMPTSLRMLCLTNFFSWSYIVCNGLYFTDFVGQGVFGGDPDDQGLFVSLITLGHF